MPSFDIVKKADPHITFRVSSVMNAFDLQTKNIVERFKGNINIENKKWNVGLIVGGSGTGKSTIAKTCFPNEYLYRFEYKEKSVVDDMPKDKSIKEITRAFTSVGFSSPPSWLKPYNVLSNGEKMRVDLARCILEEKEMFVFDEFTSVVDREVAKTGSYAISKAVRRLNKKFIAVSCHKDIIDWLEPDWVYDTDKHQFFFVKISIKNQTSKSTLYNCVKMKQKNYGKHLASIII